MDLQNASLLAALGGFCTLGGQHLYRRFFGTAYRTQKQCNDCSVRASMEVIRALVVELAIKAGVPPHEVSKIVSRMSGGCQ